MKMRKGSIIVIVEVLLAVLVIGGLAAAFSYFKIIRPETIRKEANALNTAFIAHKEAVSDVAKILNDIDEVEPDKISEESNNLEKSIKKAQTTREELREVAKKAQLNETKEYVVQLEKYAGDTEEFCSYAEKVRLFKKAELLANELHIGVLVKTKEVATFQLNLSTYYAFISKVESLINDINQTIIKYKELEPPSGYGDKVQASIDSLNITKQLHEAILSATRKINGQEIVQASKEANLKLQKVTQDAEKALNKIKTTKQSQEDSISESAEDTEKVYTKLIAKYSK